MGPYDNKDIYDDQQGLGTPSSHAPGFEPPTPTYHASPEIAESENAATNGGQDSSNDGVNSATEKEQSALGNIGESDKKGADKPEDNQNSLYTGNGKPGKQGGLVKRVSNAFGKGNSKRIRNFAILGAGSSALLGIILVIMFLFSSINGFHLINASRLLLASFSISAHQASDTYARIVTPDGEDKSKTRLTVDQKILAKKMPSILDKAGIGFTYDSTTGKAVSAHLDPSKQDGLGNSEAEIKKNLAARYGVSEADIRVNPASIGGKIDILMKGHGIAVQENIIRDFANRSGRGKVMTLLISRHFRQYLGVPSLFHPFERAKAVVKDKISGYINTKLNENERLKDFKAKMDERRLKIKGFLDANSFKIGVARISTSAALAMCAVRDVATAIEAENHASYVEPAQQSALDQIAQGEQVAYGSNNDYTADQIDSAAAHMYGDYYGQNLSIFDSDSMRARQGLPPINIKDSTAATHYATDKATIGNAFANTSPWQTAYDTTSAMGGGTICQPAVQALLTVGDIAITIGAAAISGGVGAAVKEAVSMGTVMGITSIVIGYLESASTNQLPDMTPNQGILGGDLMSYGADSVANVVSANSGGAVVSSDRAAALKKEAANVDLSIAKDQTIAEKLSPTNIYSPVAKLVNGINPSATTNLRNVASSLTNIFVSTIRLPLTLFSSHAHADDTSSGSSINTVALTEAVEKLIKMERPNKIVSDAGSILKNQGYSGDYGTRAGICFGATFLDSTDAESGDTYFDIQINNTVDEGSPIYKERNCNDEKDTNWVVISAAVHIVTVADAGVCRETGDNDACTRTGAGTTSSAASTTQTDTSGAIGEPNTSNGRSQGQWGGYSNGKVPETAMTQLTASFLGVSSGDTIQICSTKMSDPYLNPNAAVSIKALNDAFKQKFGHMMYFQSCYRDIAGQEYAKAKYGKGAATVGTSNHGWGLAVDIGPNPKKDQGCDSSSSDLTSSEKDMCQWITDNAPKYGWKNGKDVVPSEQWHFEYSRTLPSGSGS